MARPSRYELIAKLASGGMGTVFVGRVRGPLGFSRLVAIKRAHPHLMGDPQFVSMLMGEAKLASRISHPHVVSVLDVERVKEVDPSLLSASGEIRLVMDYVEGATLAELSTLALSRGAPLPPRIAVRVVLDAAAGLHAAHELKDDHGAPLGIVHRDVSPHNILVGVDGMTRVSDFGIAKATMRPGATTSGALKGKLAYMAPEYVASGALDARSDVFSLGTVLWEAIAGRKLFKGDSEVETLRLVAECEVPSLASIAPALAPLDSVMSAVLSKDPDARFSTARAFASALETAARKEDLVATHAEVADFVAGLTQAELDKRRSFVRDRVKELDALALSNGTTEGSLKDAVDSAMKVVGATPPPVEASLPSMPPVVDATLDGSGLSTSRLIPAAPRARGRGRAGLGRLALYAFGAGACAAGILFLVQRFALTPPAPPVPSSVAAAPSASGASPTTVTVAAATASSATPQSSTAPSASASSAATPAPTTKPIPTAAASARSSAPAKSGLEAIAPNPYAN